jgi:hypothetical protein
MTSTSNQFGTSGFARFLNLQPAGGYENCGIDLYVRADNYRNGPSQDFGPNTPPLAPPDPQTYVYEYSTRASYLVSPWISMGGVPFFAKVPGLGKPVILTFNAARAIENTDGLGPVSATATGAGFAQPPSIINQPISSIVPEPAVGSAWNYPQIYQLIEANGQTVVETNVFQVYCDNYIYTDSGVSVTAGEQVWLDTTANGQWDVWPGCPYGDLTCTADGNPGQGFVEQFPSSSMLGRFGNSPPFFVGSKQWNMAPNGSGPLYMGALDVQVNGEYFPGLINTGGSAWGPSLPGQPANTNPVGNYWNGYGGNTGIMTVRVIVVQ